MKRIFVIVWLIAFFTGCTNEKAHEVGVIIPLSGSYSDVGHWMQMGIDLAVEDLRAQYGISIVPVYEDSQSSPNKAISAYQKLKTIQRINEYISTVSSVCLALKPIVNKDGTFLFLNAGHKDLIEKNINNIYRHALTIPQEAIFLSEQIKKQERTVTRIAILYTNNDIGSEFADVFETQFSPFGVIINKIQYEEHDNNLKNTVRKLVELDPGIVVIYGYTKNFAPLIKTIREQNYHGRIYANQGFSTPSVIQNTGEAGNNVFYSDYDIPNSNEIIALNKRSVEKYGEVLSPMSIASYNIMYMLGTAILDVKNGNSENVSMYMNNLQQYDINGMHLVIKGGEVYVPLKLVENK